MAGYQGSGSGVIPSPAANPNDKWGVAYTSKTDDGEERLWIVNHVSKQRATEMCRAFNHEEVQKGLPEKYFVTQVD